MIAARIPPTRAAPLRSRLATFARLLPQRLHEGDFWRVQAAVLVVTAAHVAAEVWAEHADSAVPAAFHHIPVVLYLVPITYAGLRFGTEGAALTGLWSAALTVPNLLVWHRADYDWLEFLYVAVVIAVGIVMSLPVERERQQRRRAEAALQRQALLNDIATLTLTADLPTTLHRTLRRLLEMLDLRAVGVTIAGQPVGSTPAAPVVLARDPDDDHARQALAAVLRDHGQRHGTSPPKGAAGVIAVPLSASGSGPAASVQGLLGVRTDADRPMSGDDLRLLDGVANHLAVAVANQRLSESERNRLRSYTRLMTRAQEDERTRIARELHDEASQNLVVIRRSLAALAARLGDGPDAAQLDRLRALAGETVAGIRRFSRDLRPPTLDELGLSSALDQLAAQVQDRSGLVTEVRIEGTYRRLPIETELAIFRIGQAALHNVERHAAATAVEVVLVFEPERVCLDISDDGRGFVLPRTLEELPEAGKLGLMGMHERAQLVGGELRIDSRPGSGTRVLLEVPG